MSIDLEDAPAVTRKDIKPDRELTATAVTINRPAHELFA
jgi:hypothetical protein